MQRWKYNLPSLFIIILVISRHGDLYLHGGNNWGFTSGFSFNLRNKYGFVFFTNSNQINDLAPALEAYLMNDE